MAIFIEEDGDKWGVFNHNLVKNSILDNIELSKNEDAPPSLQMKLAVAAQRGIIAIGGVDAVADSAALEGLTDTEALQALCLEKGVSYEEVMWTDDEVRYELAKGKGFAAKKRKESKGQKRGQKTRAGPRKSVPRKSPARLVTPPSQKARMREWP